MLTTLTMPDGTACKAFHASAIMNQSDEFEGWRRNEAFDAFDKATAVLASRPVKFAIWPCAVATPIPKGLTGEERDGIWLILFLKFFMLVLDAMPAVRSIEFVFDKKHDIEKHAHAAYDKLTGPLRAIIPDSYLEGMRFVADHDAPVLQAADLLVYEWRKSLTNRRIAPERDNRPWFPLLRATRSNGALVQYDIAQYLQEYKNMHDEGARIRRMLMGDKIGRD